MAFDEAALSLRARKKRHVRRQILATAERLIRNRGYGETTMRDVARACELSYQTLYNHFPTKGEILRTLLAEQAADLALRYETLQSGWAGALPDALDAWNTLSFAAVAEGDRALWRIATVDALQQSNDATRVLLLIGTPAQDQLKRLLVLASNRGELTVDVHLPTLGSVLLDLADYGLLRLILDPELAVDAALAALGDEMRLVISPHLANRSRERT